MYYLLFIYLLAICFIPIPQKVWKNEKLIRILLAAVPLFVLSALRYGVGADYFSYQYLYDKTSFVSTSLMRAEFPNIDLGFLYLMKGFSWLQIPCWGFVTILSFAQILAISIWIYRNSDDVSLSMLIYYSMFIFVWNFSALRQGLVITFALLLFDRELKMPIWGEVALIMGLTLLHSSALILLLYVISKRINISRNMVIGVFCLSIIVGLLPFDLIFSRFAHIEVVSRFLEYVGNSGVRNLLSFASLARIAIFSGTIVFYKAITTDSYSKNIVNGFLLGFALYLSMAFAPVAAGRFASYYYILAILVFPMIVSKAPELYSRVFAGINYVVMIALVLFLGLSMVKEVSTMRLQTEFSQGGSRMPHTTLFNSDATMFNSTYARLVHDYEMRDVRYASFKNNEPVIIQSPKEALDTDQFVSVWSESLQSYIYLNQKGERVTDLTSHSRTPVYGFYSLRPDYYGGYPIDSVYNLVEGTISDPRSIVPEVSIDFSRSHEIPTSEVVALESINPNIKLLFTDPSLISSVTERTFAQNNYKIHEVIYQTVPVYVYTDMNDNLFVERYFSSGLRLYNNSFIVAEGFNTREIYNLNNTLIWVEPTQTTSTLKN